VTGAHVAATGSFGREDQSLVDAPDIYFEAGDHQALVHVSGGEFLKLMANTLRGQISHRA
jgi:Ala-tRNA(Pro) deacylase